MKSKKYYLFKIKAFCKNLSFLFHFKRNKFEKDIPLDTLWFKTEISSNKYIIETHCFNEGESMIVKDSIGDVIFKGDRLRDCLMYLYEIDGAYSDDICWFFSVRNIFNFDGRADYFNKKGEPIINYDNKNGISGVDAFRKFDERGKLNILIFLKLY